MKYNIDHDNDLIIKNDSGKVIFAMSNDNYWFKYDHDQNGNIIYFEDSTGAIDNYEK